mgnify:FL=1
MNNLSIIEKEKQRTLRMFITLLILIILLFFTTIIAVSIGPITIPFSKTASILLNKLQIPIQGTYTDQQWVVITEIRLPRVLIAGLVGSALAASGVAMQGLFRNPLVEPGFIGVSSGAAFGAVSAIFFGWSSYHTALLPISAFVGALGAMIIILAVWKVSQTKSIAMLLLLGIGINAFFASVTNVLIASAKTEQELRSAISWLQGSLEARTWEHVVTISPPIIFGSILLLFLGRQLNIMLLGEDHAKSAGINVKVLRNGVLALAALITGAAVAVSGIISFVGLVVPHILRLIVGPDHRILLPASLITGAIFLIVTDLISRMLLQPITLQVGVVSAMIGAPVFILLILRSKRGLGL